ncbi:MAG: site-2 protease family protein [Acidobacteriota bacterium]|nr:site-2 protease family protein [Blastocatellia bacterium]MDW8238991.1 site-2 protease family protein [Acidobacteriota bacterium]
MTASLHLGRIWGIPIGLHWSWFLIFGLVTWSLALGFFPREHPGLPPPAYWVLGAITSVLFFASVLIHELGHTYFALRDGLPVRAITLFLFGGVAQLGQEPRTPASEFRISIAGPLTSLALAGLFALLYQLDQAIVYLAAPSLWLARINFILAVFNMIPGFPLDGGRVLRAILWHFTGSLQRATQIASFSGQVIAFGFIGWGMFTMFRGGLFEGLWLAFIGWFLQNAAAATYAAVNLQQVLRGVRVARVMAPGYPQVSGQTLLDQLVEDHVMGSGQRYFFVAEAGRPRGMVTLREVTRVPRAQWSQTSAEQVMVPWDRLTRITPNMELQTALQTMDDANVAQVPVVEDDQIVGVLSREHVLHYIRTRAELGI